MNRTGCVCAWRGVSHQSRCTAQIRKPRQECCTYLWGLGHRFRLTGVRRFGGRRGDICFPEFPKDDPDREKKSYLETYTIYTNVLTDTESGPGRDGPYVHRQAMEPINLSVYKYRHTRSCTQGQGPHPLQASPASQDDLSSALIGKIGGGTGLLGAGNGSSTQSLSP